MQNVQILKKFYRKNKIKQINDSKTRQLKKNKYKSEWNTKSKFCDVCNFWTTNNMWYSHKKSKVHLENVEK